MPDIQPLSLAIGARGQLLAQPTDEGVVLTSQIVPDKLVHLVLLAADMVKLRDWINAWCDAWLTKQSTPPHMTSEDVEDIDSNRTGTKSTETPVTFPVAIEAADNCRFFLQLLSCRTKVGIVVAANERSDLGKTHRVAVMLDMCGVLKTVAALRSWIDSQTNTKQSATLEDRVAFLRRHVGDDEFAMLFQAMADRIRDLETMIDGSAAR